MMKLFFKKHTKKQRVFLLHKRYLAIPAALLAVCALCLVTTLPTYVSASTTQRQLPIYCVQRDFKTCALSFDAAWGNNRVRHTPPCPEHGQPAFGFHRFPSFHMTNTFVIFRFKFV